ncbi:MAG: MATE family efflux transporter [Bacteroidales bacterium]|nr:MATE family efflux transporter [Bacteroidales bacterium]
MPFIKTNKIRDLFGDLLASVKGSDQDFTEIPLRRAIILLSVPMVLEMLMESVFAVVDIFFVSRLGADAVATVGLTESVITIIYAIGMGLATATTSLVSRRIGEKDPEQASRTAFQAIVAGIFVSAVLAIAGYHFAGDILSLMGASPSMVRELSGYTSIMLGSNTVIMLLFIINSVFRSSGDAATAMKVLWLGNILNIILDPCLIFGWGPFPEMGIKGAAVATATGRGIAVIWQFIILFRGHKRVKLRLRHMVPDPAIIIMLFKLSLGGIGQNLIGTTSWIFMVRIISVFGSTVVAGYTIAIRVVIFALLPSSGISNASSTLVGQNLGAGKPDRAEKAAWKVGWVNSVLMGLIGLILVLWPEPFIRFFIDDKAVISEGTAALRIVSAGFISYALGMVMIGAINGAGDTFTPTKIFLFVFWMVEIPLAWLLALPLGLDQFGVYYAIVFSETLLTVTAWLVFRRGKWKLRKV